MSHATSAGSTGWPQGDFEYCWRAIQQLAKKVELTVLDSGLAQCHDRPNDWQTQWLVAHLCRFWHHDRIPYYLQELMGLASDGLVKTEIYKAWIAQGSIAQIPIEQAFHNPEERPWLLPALAVSSDPALQSLLLGCVTDPDPQWRSLAAQALGASADPAHHSIIQQLCRDPVALVRHSALEAIRLSDAWSRADRLPVFQALSDDPDSEVRHVAIWGMAAVATPTAWQALAAIAAESPSARSTALAALADGRDLMVLDVLATLSTDSWTLADWQACLRSLGQHPQTQAATALLLRWLPSCPYPTHCLYSLRQLNDRTTLPVLRSLLVTIRDDSLKAALQALIHDWEKPSCD